MDRLWVVLAAQTPLQVAVLTRILWRVSSEEGYRSFGRALGLSLAVSIGAVGLEAWLIAEAGWLALVPPLALTVTVLGRESWPSIWQSFVVVALLCATSIFLAQKVDRAARAPAIADRNAAAPVHASDALRYQQIANNLDFAGQTRGSEPEAVPTAVDGGSAAATGQVAAAAVPTNAPPEKPRPPPNPVNWTAARECLDVGGTMTLRNNKRVAFVNRRTMQVGQETAVDYRDRRYTWRLAAIDPSGLSWDQVSVVDLKPIEPVDESDETPP